MEYKLELEPADGQTTHCIEKNYRGQVERARFQNGGWAQYRYDSSGQLYAFTYARLAWSLSGNNIWIAQDSYYDYQIEARIAVELDGTLHIEKEDMVRTIDLDGLRTDQYNNGTSIESKRLKSGASPADLLASCKPVMVKFQKPCITIFNTDALPAYNTGLLEQAEGIAKNPQSALLTYNVRNRIKGSEIFGNVILFLSQYLTKLLIYILSNLMGLRYLGLLPHLDRLATLHYERCQITQAEAIHMQALKIKEEYLGAKHPDLSVNLYGLALIAEKQGKHQEAEELYKQAAELQEKRFTKSRFLWSSGLLAARKFASDYYELLQTLHHLAKLYDEQNKSVLAGNVHKDILAFQALYDKKHNKLK